MKVAIVSADTMIYRKQKDDTCSPIVRRVLDQVSFKTELVQPVPNDREVIRKILAKIADAQMADLILTIGSDAEKRTVFRKRQRQWSIRRFRGSESRCVFL